jgi:hypothetical protein
MVFSPLNSNKKAVEVVRNHKAMVSAFFLLSHLLFWLFHVINSSDNTSLIIFFEPVLLHRLRWNGVQDFKLQGQSCHKRSLFFLLKCTHVVEKVLLFLLSPCMLVCVLIYVVCFVTSLAHLSSRLNCRQLFRWLSIIFWLCDIHIIFCIHCIFFKPPVMSFFPICACEPVLVLFLRRVCVSSADFLQHHCLWFRTGCFTTCWRLSLFCYAQHLFFYQFPFYIR